MCPPGALLRKLILHVSALGVDCYCTLWCLWRYGDSHFAQATQLPVRCHRITRDAMVALEVWSFEDSHGSTQVPEIANGSERLAGRAYGSQLSSLCLEEMVEQALYVCRDFRYSTRKWTLSTVTKGDI